MPRRTLRKRPRRPQPIPVTDSATHTGAGCRTEDGAAASFSSLEVCRLLARWGRGLRQGFTATVFGSRPSGRENITSPAIKRIEDLPRHGSAACPSGAQLLDALCERSEVCWRNERGEAGALKTGILDVRVVADSARRLFSALLLCNRSMHEPFKP